MHIYMINSDEINSFVAAGQNIFIFTGLLMRADNANQVVGVMAHETGHVAGGHLARMSEEMRNASMPMIVGLLLGAATAVATGKGEALGAGMSAGSSIAERTFLSFSRTHERSADQAAATFLEQTGQSARGLLQFFEKLQQQEYLSGARMDPYLMTHPLTQDRIEFLQRVVANSKYPRANESSQRKEEFARMMGKLVGFLQPTPRVFQRYKPDDDSIGARYAHAIAYHRMGQLDDAQKIVDKLLAARPDDPYINELKGQFLFEDGKVPQSVAFYQTANRLLPHNSLLETEMAQSMIETGDHRYDEAALAALKDASQRDDENALTWRLRATIEGRRGDMPQAALDLAEEFYAEGNFRAAKGEAIKAQKLLPNGSPGYLRAQDIETASTQAMKDARR
jgi:predicted Zn-dependent protease